jgi:hypothetical protein
VNDGWWRFKLTTSQLWEVFKTRKSFFLSKPDKEKKPSFSLAFGFGMLCLSVSVSVSAQTKPKFRYFGFGLNSGFGRSLISNAADGRAAGSSFWLLSLYSRELDLQASKYWANFKKGTFATFNKKVEAKQ